MPPAGLTAKHGPNAGNFLRDNRGNPFKILIKLQSPASTELNQKKGGGVGAPATKLSLEYKLEIFPTSACW
jgi:hypothetical protein